MNEQNKSLPEEILSGEKQSAYSRRRFLGVAGVLAGAGMVGLASCNKDDNASSGGVNLGSGDVGILNYAYALEQLEAAFYAQVVKTPYSGITATEKAMLMEIAAHEDAHAKFFKAAIIAAGGTPIQNLNPNFSSITFSDRKSVLETARTFEDLGVAAYNGAGKLIKTAAYLTIAGQVVSVEARHAAMIRDLLSNGSFADLSTLSAFGSDNGKGLDGALTPAQVLALAQPFIKETLNASNLPTS